MTSAARVWGNGRAPELMHNGHNGPDHEGRFDFIRTKLEWWNNRGLVDGYRDSVRVEAAPMSIPLHDPRLPRKHKPSCFNPWPVPSRSSRLAAYDVRVRGRNRTEIVWIEVKHLRDRACGGLWPAFVVGKELRDGAYGPASTRARSAHRRYDAVGIAHQHGGYGCLQARLHGLVLPLHENRERAISAAGAEPQPVDVLLDALGRRAQSLEVEDRSHPVLPLPLRPMGTGQALTASELSAFEGAIASAYESPAPVRGWEALLDLGPLDAAWLTGWSAVMFTPGDDGFAHPADRKRLTQRHASALGEPHLWLVWENCD